MSKTVETLVSGETLLVSARKVKNGKVSLEFAEVIANPNSTSSSSNALISFANKSDSRFSSRGARRAWITGEQGDLEEMVGQKFGDLDEPKALNILNPQHLGLPIRIQVNETTEGDEYQKANIETTAKKAGRDGDFIMSGGKHIFSNTVLVQGEATHTFLQGDPSAEAAQPVAASSDELAA